MRSEVKKTICPPNYHDIGIVATHALGYKVQCYTLLVPMN